MKPLSKAAHRAIITISLASSLCILNGCVNRPNSLALAQIAYIQQNYGVSFYQLQKVAATGDKEAQYALGYMYYYGKGTRQDSSQARYWFIRASKNGSLQAQQALMMLDENQPEPTATGLMPNRRNNQDNHKKNTQPSSQIPLPKVTKKYSQKKMKQSQYERNHFIIKSQANSAKKANQRQAPLTIRLFASNSLKQIHTFIKNHHLKGRVRIEKDTQSNKPWYTVEQGQYYSIKQANQAIAAMSPQLKKSNPWIQKNTTH